MYNSRYLLLKIGVITSGIPYQYVKEAMPEASVLKLGMVHPLPKKLIEDFAAKVDTLYIVEELEHALLYLDMASLCISRHHYILCYVFFICFIWHFRTFTQLYQPLRMCES